MASYYTFFVSISMAYFILLYASVHVASSLNYMAMGVGVITMLSIVLSVVYFKTES